MITPRGRSRGGTHAIREHLRRRGIAATIPERVDQQANRRRRGRAGGRPPVFDPVAYRRRNVVERCFQRLKQYRAIATRYDKTATSYQGMLVDLSTLVMWLLRTDPRPSPSASPNEDGERRCPRSS